MFETSGVVVIMSAVFSGYCDCLSAVFIHLWCSLWLLNLFLAIVTVKGYPKPQLENYCTIFIEHPSFVFSAVIGEIDEEADANLDLNSIRADPLNAVVYWLMDIIQTSTM